MEYSSIVKFINLENKQSIIVNPFWSSLLFFKIYEVLLKNKIELTIHTYINEKIVEEILVSLDNIIQELLEIWYEEPDSKKFNRRRLNYVIVNHKNGVYKINYRESSMGRAIYAFDVLKKFLFENRFSKGLYIEFHKSNS